MRTTLPLPLPLMVMVLLSAAFACKKEEAGAPPAQSQPSRPAAPIPTAPSPQSQPASQPASQPNSAPASGPTDESAYPNAWTDSRVVAGLAKDCAYDPTSFDAEKKTKI